MKKFSSILFILIITLNLSGQVNLTGFTNEDKSRANNAKNHNSLSLEEKQVFFYVNLSRIAPLQFVQLVEKYVVINELGPSIYINSLIKELKQNVPVDVLQPRNDLNRSSKEYALFAGRSGKTGHYNFKQRMQPLLKEYEVVGENCDYGNDIGLDIVMSLLIDEGIENLGHRITILDSKYKYMGVSIKPHKKYKINCVQHFGG